MKYYILFVLSFALISCGDSNQEKTTQSDSTEDEALKEEIVTLDSISATVDEINAELEATSQELNDLLNDLN